LRIGTFTLYVPPFCDGPEVGDDAAAAVCVRVGVTDAVLPVDWTMYRVTTQPLPCPGMVTGTHVYPPAATGAPVTVPVWPSSSTTTI